MIRTYGFYEDNFKLYKFQVDRINSIINDVENGIYNDEEIRSLGKEGLLFCICEGKYEVFKTLVSPFSYQDGDKVRYRYLLDAVSLEVVDYIRNCPQSIMEHWARVNENAKSNAEFDGKEFSPIPVEFTSRNAVVLYPSLKKELIDAILFVDKAKIMTTKIKDVLAKQICGTGHPIRSIQDVVYYAELPLLFPCIDLFRKNIITKSNDTGGCYDDYVADESQEFVTNLIVDYDSLDETNRVVADALVESGHAHFFYNECAGHLMRELVIEVPCKRNETVYQVTKRMLELVSKFQKQDMIYDVDIFINENQVKVRALLDTGNLLKDPITGFPVIVVEHKSLSKVLPEKVLDNLDKKDLAIENVDALLKGITNLEKHIENIGKYNLPYVVAINKFGTDTLNEVNALEKWAKDHNHPVALSEVFAKGGDGGIELAKKVVEEINLHDGAEKFAPIYDTNLSIKDKISAICTEIYGATKVEFTTTAKNQMAAIKRNGWDNLPICIAKTQYSLSDNPKLLARPENFTITIRELKPSIGAGFIVALSGDIMTMPGLPKEPAANKMDVVDGKAVGLF